MKRPIKSGLAVDGKISAVQGTEPGEVVVLDGSGKLPVDNLNTILVQQGGTGVTVLPEGALLQGNGINAVTRADSVGGTTQPIYIDIDGKAKTISYTVSKSVPADAVFTDTTYENRQAAEGGTDLSLVTTGDKYNWDHMEDTDTKDTAGSTDTSSKIFIIGAASQTSYSQTYSHDTAYVGTDGCLYSDGQKVLTSHQSLAAYAPLDSPALTGMPTAPTAASGTDTTQIATTAFVQDAVSASHIVTDAMVFKGTIGTGGTVASLPADHTVGWTYKVITAGSYAGKNCEVGDLIICTNTRVTANNDDWTVAQTNIDGAVTGPANAVDTHIAVFDGTSGKVIKDSGFTIAKSVPADAKFTDTTYTPASSVTAVGTAAVIGTSTNYARQDHVHDIALATGDNNGQVKIAGSNVSVKGLGTAAYTASTDYLASGTDFATINGTSVKSDTAFTVVTSETQLSKGTTTGSGNVVSDISVSGHTITLTKGVTALTSETSLSLGTTTGTGNAVTDLSVSGHQITMTKGSTFADLSSSQALTNKTYNGYTLGNACEKSTASEITSGGTGLPTAGAVYSYAQAKHTVVTVTLDDAGWSNSAQTVNATGVTADNTIFVSPAPASAEAYGEAGVLCTTQGSGTLTFTCTTTPSTDISVNVTILG